MRSVRNLLAQVQNIWGRKGIQLEKFCRLNRWNLNVGNLCVVYIYLLLRGGCMHGTYMCLPNFYVMYLSRESPIVTRGKK